jgi:5-oxoprolinase (ATP-hydrolysing)
VARRPDGQLVVHKLLSENPDRYPDAPLQGIRDLMGLATDDPIPAEDIAALKMGTTVATNALLERKGDRTLLVITDGFQDALRIGYQNRPDIFARHIELPEMLYERVIGVPERIDAHGEILQPLTPDSEPALVQQLQQAYDDGIVPARSSSCTATATPSMNSVLPTSPAKSASPKSPSPTKSAP